MGQAVGRSWEVKVQSFLSSPAQGFSRLSLQYSLHMVSSCVSVRPVSSLPWHTGEQVG